MTATEKYLNMNHAFIQLRDAIFEADVDEKDEHADVQKQVETALLVLNNYLDYYKELNSVKTRVRGE